MILTVSGGYQSQKMVGCFPSHPPLNGGDFDHGKRMASGICLMLLSLSLSLSLSVSLKSVVTLLTSPSAVVFKQTVNQCSLQLPTF